MQVHIAYETKDSRTNQVQVVEHNLQKTSLSQFWNT